VNAHRHAADGDEPAPRLLGPAEIRDLADRTSSSTKAIAQVIRENEEAVQQAVDRMGQVSAHLASGRQLVDKAGGALDSIIENSGKVLESIKQVTQSSEEQAETTLHIGRNTQVWEIRIENEDGKLVCISRLTLAVVPRQSPKPV